MCAKAGLGDEEVRGRQYGNTAIRAIQRWLWGEEEETDLLATLAITAVHLLSFLLVPHHRIIRIVQPIVCIRIDLKLGVDGARLGPRAEAQKGGYPVSTTPHALCQFIPTAPFELHIGI